MNPWDMLAFDQWAMKENEFFLNSRAEKSHGGEKKKEKKNDRLSAHLRVCLSFLAHSQKDREKTCEPCLIRAGGRWGKGPLLMRTRRRLWGFGWRE